MSLHRVSILLAGLLALLGSVGSLYLTWGMKLEACALCFYQRAFMLSTLGILVVGALSAAGRLNLALLALPTASAGLVLAAQHTRILNSGVLECPDGIAGLGSAPFQSLMIYSVLNVVLLVGWFFGVGEERGNNVAGMAGIFLGVAMGFACLNSNPALKAPTRPYDPIAEPLVGCRKPYQETP